ncbi:MAG TPA: TIGR03013 family XrtA/PEP-CTERM system glycosyltransferase [Gammaproteobacteria bacterium]|nr:TIGR03013 family XrtA/PEP-CTERM system glycosyltransferase [Gammaproteobacteria bacterium]
MGKIRIFRRHIPLQIILIGAIETLLLVISFYLAAYLRFEGQPAVVADNLGPLHYPALLFAGMMILSLSAMGLYQIGLRERRTGILLRLVVGFGVGIVLLMLIYYIFPVLYVGRGVLALAVALSFLFIMLLRPALLKVLDIESIKPRVLVLGTGSKASSIIKRMRRRSDRRGFRLAGFIHYEGENCEVHHHGAVLKVHGSIARYAMAHQIDEIVVALDERRNKLSLNDLLRCRLAGIEVLDLATFFERETGAVALDLVDPSWLIFGDGFRRGFLRAQIKRLLDISIALVLLVMTLPVLLLTALLIILDDGWHKPVLYSQTRVGERGTLFRVLKFRSMRTDAEQEGVRWARKNDSRVTRVGALIRKCRVDELPQILNVLRGDMSFVGPRPERPEFVTQLEKNLLYYRERHSVKPGITGWAQLRYPYGSSERDAREKLKFDLFYVKNHTVFFDLLIMLQTVEVVLFGKGAR